MLLATTEIIVFVPSDVTATVDDLFGDADDISSDSDAGGDVVKDEDEDGREAVSCQMLQSQ